MSDTITKHEFVPSRSGIFICYVCGHGKHNEEYHFPPDKPKTLVLGKVVERYPRMLGLLIAAALELRHTDFGRENDRPCVLCQIRDFLKECEQ